MRMGHYAILAPAYTGHLNPLLVLARALQRRGHRITFLAPADAEAKLRQAGMDFLPIAALEFPAGEWTRRAAHAGALTGFKASRAAGKTAGHFTRGIQRDLPGIATREGFDGLIMDQICIGTEGVCEATGLPMAVACSALAFHTESRVPPPLFSWRYRTSLPFRLRNLVGQFALNSTGWSVLREVTPYRFRHRLSPPGFYHINELRPSLVQVAQQPAFFDFPRRHLPDHFHYTAPWIDADVGGNRNFPWNRLDGRPLIYASLGTLQNRLEHVFQTISQACAGLEAQLVLALGREGAAVPGHLAGNPIVVDYAPQLALLRRAALVITHAGLNTTLESLREGVPMVALPITNDQPGVAARIHHLGVGEFVPIKKFTAPLLRQAVVRVMGSPSYREQAKHFAAILRREDGAADAAELIEAAFTSRRRVTRNRAPPAGFSERQ